GPETLSELGQRFLGGVLAKAPSFCAITNPTVNSYKRLNGAATASGYTWSPNRVSWSGNNRSHMVRVPDKDRFELRLADGAVNPYLLPAVMLACGFWGLDSKADAQKCFFPTSVNMYEIPDGSPELQGILTLPRNLLDATRSLEEDKQLQGLLGAAPWQNLVTLAPCAGLHKFWMKLSVSLDVRAIESAWSYRGR
ncbi:unnamed protein product, partial [Effrenium voratum]